MDVTIRSFRPDDLAAIKAITVEAFDGVSIDRNIEAQFGEIHGHDWRWRKARHIDEDARRDPGGILVAEAGSEIIGYITTYRDMEAGLGLIPNLALTAEARGQGLGRRLIQAALDLFRASGLTHARIETLAQNEVGQNLYPSLGFREVARQIHYCLRLNEGQQR